MNLLGPLVNPARPTWQVMGVYAPHLVRPIAETLRRLGVRSALVVHGSGLDELALHGPTTAARLRAGRIEDLILTPEDAGLPRAAVTELTGAGPEESGPWLRELLAGRGTPAQADAVALNAGALLWIADRAGTLAEGARLASAVIAEGSGADRLRLLLEEAA